MSWRPSASGSQLRKWSNERFSIMSTTTCSTPSEPPRKRAADALAAAWDRSSEPVAAAPADAPMSVRNFRRVSMMLSTGNGHERQDKNGQRHGDTGAE